MKRLGLAFTFGLKFSVGGSVPVLFISMGIVYIIWFVVFWVFLQPQVLKAWGTRLTALSN
jgi:hypothetical protein